MSNDKNLQNIYILFFKFEDLTEKKLEIIRNGIAGLQINRIEGLIHT